MAWVGFGIVHDLRYQLFTKLLYLPKRYFDDSQSGQLLNRVTYTTTQVSGATSNAVKTIIKEGALLIGLFFYMLYLDWKLTLMLIGVIHVIGLIVRCVVIQWLAMSIRRASQTLSCERT